MAKVPKRSTRKQPQRSLARTRARAVEVDVDELIVRLADGASLRQIAAEMMVAASTIMRQAHKPEVQAEVEKLIDYRDAIAKRQMERHVAQVAEKAAQAAMGGWVPKPEQMALIGMFLGRVVAVPGDPSAEGRQPQHQLPPGSGEPRVMPGTPVQVIVMQAGTAVPAPGGRVVDVDAEEAE